MTFPNDVFAGKTAVVTGGTTGIGQATAQYFAEHGAKVYAVGLDRAKVYDGAASQVDSFPAGLDVETVDLDVTDRDGAKKFFGQLSELHYLVPGAGVRYEGREHEYEVFTKTIGINLNAVMDWSTRARPLIAAAGGGAIVNFSSMFATFGDAEGPAYGASKGAIDQLTKALAVAYAGDNIRVNAVAPGWIDTPLLAPFRRSRGRRSDPGAHPVRPVRPARRDRLGHRFPLLGRRRLGHRPDPERGRWLHLRVTPAAR